MTDLFHLPDPLAALRMQKQEVGQHLTTLLKGLPGTGKTHFTLTAPKPIFYIFIEHNRETFNKFVDLYGEDQFVGLNVTSWDDYANKIGPFIKNRRFPGPTVVVDGVDMLADLLVNKIRGNRLSLAIPDWATVLNKLKEEFSKLTEASHPLAEHPGYNIIATTHTNTEYNEEGGIVSVNPRIQGQFKGIIEDFFDLSLITTKEIKSTPVTGGKAKKEQVAYALTIAPHRYETTKSPFNWPEKLSTYDDILEAVEADKKSLKEKLTPKIK